MHVAHDVAPSLRPSPGPRAPSGRQCERNKRESRIALRNPQVYSRFRIQLHMHHTSTPHQIPTRHARRTARPVARGRTAGWLQPHAGCGLRHKHTRSRKRKLSTPTPPTTHPRRPQHIHAPHHFHADTSTHHAESEKQTLPALSPLVVLARAPPHPPCARALLTARRATRRLTAHAPPQHLKTAARSCGSAAQAAQSAAPHTSC